MAQTAKRKTAYFRGAKVVYALVIAMKTGHLVSRRGSPGILLMQTAMTTQGVEWWDPSRSDPSTKSRCTAIYNYLCLLTSINGACQLLESPPYRLVMLWLAC